MNSEIGTIGILGAGQMGGGIAQMFAAAGKQVLLWDLSQAAVDHGMRMIETRLERSMTRGTMDPDTADYIRERIAPITDMAAFQCVPLLIEAVVENLENKQKLLRELSKAVTHQAIVGTNTSSLSVTELAGSWRDPARFIGIHFFNPPTKLELVEVVPTSQTESAVIDKVTYLLKECEKTPIVVKDSPGFIVNRLLFLLLNESARMVEEGVATAEDIDTAMRLGALHPAGPLAVADLIGLDTCQAILDTLKTRLDRDVFTAAPAISGAVAEGRLGRKSKRGFYSY